MDFKSKSFFWGQNENHFKKIKIKFYKKKSFCFLFFLRIKVGFSSLKFFQEPSQKSMGLAVLYFSIFL